MEKKEGSNYVLRWNSEEKKTYEPLIASIKAGSRNDTENAAIQISADQFGIPPEDLGLLPRLPSWITDEALQGKDKNKHNFHNTIIILIPPKKLVKNEPRSILLRGFKLTKTAAWFKIKYDEHGIIKGGSELTGWFKGVPPEMQDQPDNASLN